MKRFLLILLRILTGLLALVLLAAAVSQTQIFRDWVRSYAIENLRSSLDAEVVVGELHGNLIAGFSLDSLSISVDGIPVVATDRVEIRYNLLRLPGRHLSLGTVTLVRPTVNLLADRNGRWNIGRMLHPLTTTAPDTANTAEASPWSIEMHDLAIREGVIHLVDSAWVREHPEEPGFVDYQNFTLRNVNLAMSARIGGEEKEISIKRFACEMEDPAIVLEDLVLDARLTRSDVRIELLQIRTDRSSLTFTGSLAKFDLLGGMPISAMKRSPVKATLAFDALDLAELRQLLPPVAFLDGKVNGILSVGGEFGRMEIDRFELRHGQTALRLTGTLSNLHHASDLVLDVRMDENTIDGADVRALLPGLDLPDLSPLGVASVSLRFAGRPLDFSAGIVCTSEIGSLTIPEVAMKIGGSGGLAYAGGVTFRGVDVGRLLGEEGLRSRLNGSARADGRGTTFRTLLSSFEVRLDSSTFLGEPIDESWVSVGIRERRLLGRVQGRLGAMRAELTGRLDETPDGTPSFTLNGGMSGLDLRRVLGDQRHESDIGVTIDASGRGLSWEHLDGTLLLDFSRSRYRDVTLDSAYLQCTVTSLDSGKKLLTVGSQMLDVVVEGAFTPASFARYARYYAEAIRSDVAHRLAAVDTTFRSLSDPGRLTALGRQIRMSAPSPDASFTIQLKSLEPLAAILNGPKVTGTGIVSGELAGKPESLRLNSRLLLDEFAYGNEAQGGLFIDRADLLITADGITPTEPIDRAAIRILGTMDRMAINRSRFESLAVDLRYGDTRGTFTAGLSGGEGKGRLDVGGEIGLHHDTIGVVFQRLDVGYESYAWRATPGMRLDVSGRGVHFRDVELTRGEERVRFDGVLRGGESLEGRLRATAFDLDALKYLLAPQTPGKRRAFFNGTADVDLDVEGRLSDPRYRGTIRGRDVYVRNMLLGSVTGDLTYDAYALSGTVTATDSAGSSPELIIKGRIPMDLSLAGDPVEGIGDRTAELAIQAHGFQMAVLDPFLPAFDEFQGLLECDLRLSGPIRGPRYAGTFSVSHGSFLFEPNNIRYEFGGKFRAAGERIEVLGVTVQNLAEDALAGERGRVNITGDLSLKNFRPGDFNLTVRGNLLVVKESTRKSSLEVSGALYGEIGSQGLRFTGEIERSLLKGALAIRNSTLVLPPTQAQMGEESALSVPVVYVDDTTKVVQKRRKAAEQFFTGLGTEVKGEDDAPSVSFMDGLRYDLEVDAPGGSTTFEMIFNSLTAEKLVATINGRWAIRGEKSRWLGELTISQAYYNFLKRFDAEGKIRYAGDILNPEMDILATYQGQRPSQDSTGRLFEKIVVRFKITGTKREPKIETQMTIDDVDYANYRGLTSHDVQSDAIQFIVYGNFPLTVTQRNEANPDLQKQLGFSAITGATTMLTGALSEFLRSQTGFISSVDFRYGTAGRPAEIRLSGSALKGFWRFGGRFVEEPLSNADFSLLYSFESVFGEPSLRDLMFEFERRVEPSSLQWNDLKRVNSARLFYRFSF